MEILEPRGILFVDHASALGGAERSLLLMLKYLDRARWTPQLVCTEGWLSDEANDLGIPVHKIAFPRVRRSHRILLDWRNIADILANIAANANTSLIYANTVRAAVYSSLAAQLAHRPFIWHMRDLWLSESRPSTLLPDKIGKWLLCRAATRVISNSHTVAAHLPESCNPMVVHNGVDLSLFDISLDGHQFRREHNIPLDTPVIGMIGRLRPWKGQERFIRAMARVTMVVPEAHFVIVGGALFDVGDGYEHQLHKLAGKLDLAERVIFTGHSEQVAHTLAGMDIFVHPGDPEPFGLVNIEAMAMGKPVVAFAHGSLPEIVIDQHTGLLVDPENEAAMSEAVLTLLREPERRLAMGKAGRRRVKSHFTVQKMVKEIDELLKQVVD